MEDREQHAHYHPNGVPITPQARRFGYEFPVYVSRAVWSAFCMNSGLPSRHMETLEGRIQKLLAYCYEGMAKKLTQTDDFVFYYFKIWYWSRTKPKAKKQARARLGARLFLDPSTNAPWMYIFHPNVDSIDMLEPGEAPAEFVDSDVEGGTL